MACPSGPAEIRRSRAPSNSRLRLCPAVGGRTPKILRSYTSQSRSAQAHARDTSLRRPASGPMAFVYQRPDRSQQHIYFVFLPATHFRKRSYNALEHSNQFCSTMADNEKSDGEISQHASENTDIQYPASFKLAAIMVTINLSTMVAALDLVSSHTDKNYGIR